MKYRIKNTALWAALILIFAAFVPVIYITERQSMFEILNALAVGGAIGALIRWSPSAWEALKPPIHILRSRDYLVVGLGMVCSGGALRLASQWFWRAYDKPSWIIDSAFVLYVTLMITVGFFLLLVPTFSDEFGLLAKGAYLKTATLAGISIIIALSLILIGWGA